MVSYTMPPAKQMGDMTLKELKDARRREKRPNFAHSLDAWIARREREVAQRRL